MFHLLRGRFTLGGTIAAALLGFVVIVAANAGLASANVNHGSLVPETARRDLPVVVDGAVFAHAQVGDRIFVGGDFQQVELIDGTIIDQAYIFAYDIDTGIVDPNFRPVLNNMVRTLEARDNGDGLYVGGHFWQWDSSFPNRIARLDAEGNLDTSFSASASARVMDIEQVGNSVYVVGDFLAISGEAATGIAKLDANTGMVDTSFLPQITSGQNGSNLAKSVVASPDGSSVFIMHFGLFIDGQSREAVAKYDIDAAGNPSLSGWNIPWVAQSGTRVCINALRDMAISPDGSFIVVGGQGNDFPPNCDSVLRFPTAGNATVNFDWSARMYSSVFSIAISDTAVYVGGHFCAAPAQGAEPGGVTSDYDGLLAVCYITDPGHPSNPSSIDTEGAVFRSQMAALDPSNGQALDWDPGSNGYVGVYDLTLIDRGLLAGHDGDRFSTFLVGASGFFDFQAGATDTAAPSFAVTSPLDASVPASVTELTGTASDDRDVASVTVRLRNVTTGQWLQANGSFGANRVDLPVIMNATNLGEVEWSVSTPSLPAGEYRIDGFATDTSGNTNPTASSTFTIAGATSCTVVLNADDLPEITMTGFVADHNNSTVIRRDGSWHADVELGATTFVDSSALPGDYTYEVRWRPNGVATDVACTPNSINVPQGGGAISCSAGLDANGDPVLSWDAVAGVNDYVVREAAQGWVATVTNGTSYTEANAAPGDYSYSIRIRINGVSTDIPCQPSPLTVTAGNGGNTPTCTAAVNGAGNVIVNWTAVDGVSAYQVRDNDGWVATSNGLTYTDTNPATGQRTYEIRYRSGGQANDITCSPNPITVN